MDTFRTIIAGWVIGFILLFFVAVKRNRKYAGRDTGHRGSNYCDHEEDEEDPEEDPDIPPASRIYITQEVPSVFDELRGKKK